jgi:hypothetical protein
MICPDTVDSGVEKNKPMKRKREEVVSIPRFAVVCSICTDIMHAPHHLACSCRNSFCKTCIDRWMITNDKCPACNKKPPKSTRLPIASGKQWGDAMDLIKRACPVHVDCRYRRGGYEDTQKHAENECVYRKIPCPNEGCRQLVVYKYMTHHARLCTLRRCVNYKSKRFGCSMQGTNEFIKQHEKQCKFGGEVFKQLGDLMVVAQTIAPPSFFEDVAHDDGDRGGACADEESGATDRPLR